VRLSGSVQSPRNTHMCEEREGVLMSLTGGNTKANAANVPWRRAQFVDAWSRLMHSAKEYYSESTQALALCSHSCVALWIFSLFGTATS
jgi:hypothetical protein